MAKRCYCFLIKLRICWPLLNWHPKILVYTVFLFPVFHQNSDTDLRIIPNRILRPKFFYRHRQFLPKLVCLRHKIASYNSYRFLQPCLCRHRPSLLILLHVYRLWQIRAPPFRKYLYNQIPQVRQISILLLRFHELKIHFLLTELPRFR